MVDPVKVVESQVMPAPDVTLGDTDTSVAGIANAVVGIDSSMADPPDPPSSGHTFWVDNTPLSGDCPQATFTTIQAAVDASGPNDTVKVCPGIYPEQVRIMNHIHDGLRIESLTPLAATIKWTGDGENTNDETHKFALRPQCGRCRGAHTNLQSAMEARDSGRGSFDPQG